MWNLPRPGIEPICPALAGKFFTTRPPGKPWMHLLNHHSVKPEWWLRWLRICLQCRRLEIQPVNPKGNQSWVFIGRTDMEAETPILWPHDAKSWLTGKDPDAGKDWRWEEKGATEDEMVGWHHRLNGHEFEWSPGLGGGQGSLACCSPWGCKELDMTEWLNWPDKASPKKL